VDSEVRELMRRRGLDPFTDPGPVRVLVRDVVALQALGDPVLASPPCGSTRR
jgi:pilus assembly protein CpaF